MYKFIKIKYLLFLIIASHGAITCNQKTIYNAAIIPFIGYENNRLFDLTDKQKNRDNCLLPFFKLKESFEKLGISLNTSSYDQNFNLLICLLLCEPPADRYTAEKINYINCDKKIAFLWEPPVTAAIYYDKQYHSCLSTVFTLIDSFDKDPKYKKFFYPQPSLSMITPVSFNQKNFCTMIAGNKNSSHPDELYCERRKAIEFFDKFYPQDFDLYGIGWECLNYKSCKGQILNKQDILKNYKFAICYENTKNINGYITEKIFDCFVAGTVPVYWGAQNINKYIPETCYILREKFSSNHELYNCLKNMSEEDYEKYLINIQNFLSSPQAFAFSCDYFIHTIISAIIPDYDRSAIFNKWQQDMIEQVNKLFFA